MSTLARRQLAQTRKELEADQRRKGRARLKSIRAEIKAAKLQRQERRRAVSAQCKSARRHISARAKRARARLSESIKRTRENARGLCLVARGEVEAQMLEHIDQAVRRLNEEQAEQRRLRIWAGKAPPAGTPTGRGRSQERRTESDDEVLANIDDPALHVVWEHVKAKIRPKGRSSRTEVFAEWVAEHSAEVYEIIEADAVRHLEQLERQERQLAKALGRKRYREPEGLEAVPF